MTASLRQILHEALVRLEHDERWFRDTTGMAIGASAPMGDDTRVWENLGFVPDADHPAVGTRLARLDGTFDGIGAECEDFSHIDCVTVLTIERSNKQYIYDTLRSVFTTFPADVHVNLAVGDDRAEFVSRGKLVNELGAERTRHVHVHPASAEQTACVKGWSVTRRAAWNYARAIRSYQGTQGLLLMEDDVQWAVGGISRFDYWLAGHRMPVVSLYNYQSPPWPDQKPFKVAHLVLTSVDEPRHIFDCTQAMYISAPVARALGDYILLRIHTMPYDLLLDRFCAEQRLSIGHAYPSLVQHMGEQTNGLGRFHQSNCFVPSLVRRETPE